MSEELELEAKAQATLAMIQKQQQELELERAAFEKERQSFEQQVLGQEKANEAREAKLLDEAARKARVERLAREAERKKRGAETDLLRALREFRTYPPNELRGTVHELQTQIKLHAMEQLDMQGLKIDNKVKQRNFKSYIESTIVLLDHVNGVHQNRMWNRQPKSYERSIGTIEAYARSFKIKPIINLEAIKANIKYK